MSAAISCPWCSKAIDAAGLTAGGRVQCPRCRAAFALRPEDLRAAAVAGPAAPPPPGVHTPGSPRMDNSGSPRMRAVGSPRMDETVTGRTWLVIGAGAAGALLLVGAVIVAVAFAGHHAAPGPVAVAPSPPPATTPPAPIVLPGDTPQTHPEPTPDKPHPPPLADKPRPVPLPLDIKPEPPPEPTGLSPAQEAKVKKAIERGVAYLKETQQDDGAWPYGSNVVGATALPGLTLLDCGVPADDAHVRKAARCIRNNAGSLNETYELALAILFLDRLNDPTDEPLIRTLALRLIAGQSPAGGWTYECPIPTPEDERNLLVALREARPNTTLDLIAPRSGETPSPAPKPNGKTGQALHNLPPELRALPGLRPVPNDILFPETDNTDNSCTQFGILGLWTARRHDVPTERALAWVNQRFRLTQWKNSGGWEYSYNRPPVSELTPAMTAAGLLGLAVGHGVTADLKGDDPARITGDAAIDKGMKALSRFVGAALGDKKGDTILPPADLYFLWSVERVGVLYNRRTIADKEWYPWGAEILLDNQQEDGSWINGGYLGSAPPLDTSFALLFLKRANLAGDLSTQLQFLTEIKK